MVVDAVYHPTGLGGYRYLGGGRFVNRPYERWPLPFTIQPAWAGTVTGLRAAESSAPTVMDDTVHHPPALGDRRPLIRQLR